MTLWGSWKKLKHSHNEDITLQCLAWHFKKYFCSIFFLYLKLASIALWHNFLLFSFLFSSIFRPASALDEHNQKLFISFAVIMSLTYGFEPCCRAPRLAPRLSRSSSCRNYKSITSYWMFIRNCKLRLIFQVMSPDTNFNKHIWSGITFHFFSFSFSLKIS